MNEVKLKVEVPAFYNGKDGDSVYDTWLKNGFQGSHSDFLDWMRNGSDKSLILPNLIIKSVNRNIQPGPVNNKLMVSYQTTNYEFLDFNPQIWIFIYKGKKSKSKDLQLGTYVRRKWGHPSHLHGINFRNSLFYGGNTNHPIISQGMHTEFPFNFNPITGYMEVPIDFSDWFFSDDAPITPSTDFSANNLIKPRWRRGRNTFSVKFKLAIVIDNPFYDPHSTFLSKRNPKFIGPLSETWMMKPILDQNHGYRGFKFFIRNNI